MFYNIFIRILSGFIWNSKKRKDFRHKYLIQNTFNINDLINDNEIIIIEEGRKEGKKNAIPGLNIDFLGKNSKVIIHEPISFHNCHLAVGSNNVVEFQSSIYSIENFNVPWMMSNNTKLKIGKNFSCVGANVYLHDEPNFNVNIGEECMFSFDIIIWPSDGHTIYDMNSKEALNIPNKNLRIGNHVWLCRGCQILKNSNIGNHSVVGTMSIVNRRFEQDNIIIAGTPAKIVKEGINWSRDNTYGYKKNQKNK